MILWLYPTDRLSSLTVKPIIIVSPRLPSAVLSVMARGAFIRACRSQWSFVPYIMWLKTLCRPALARMNLWMVSVRDCYAHAKPWRILLAWHPLLAGQGAQRNYWHFRFRAVKQRRGLTLSSTLVLALPLCLVIVLSCCWLPPSSSQLPLQEAFAEESV